MEQTPPPYVPATDETPQTPQEAAPETPMFGSTASRPTDEEARPGIEDTFLSYVRPSFWD